MSIVVVGAHPCADSYSRAVRDRVMAGLGTAGLDATLIDLYGGADGARMPMSRVDAAVLADATALVLVHPTWWTSQPAILLAWLDQASATGLPGVRSIVSVTTMGGSRLANFIAGESGKRVIERAVRRRCELRPQHRRLALYGLDRSTTARRSAFLVRVEARIAEMTA